MIFIAPLLLFLSEVRSQPVIPAGFCFANYTTRSPTLEPYTYTKRVQKYEKCGYRYCLKENIVLVTEQRYVYRDVIHQRPECCSGYEKTSSSTSKHGFDCNPVCEPPCVFGHCTSPGNCTCNDGYVHVTSNVCSPHCHTPCEFGTCTGPDTCTCFQGYTRRTDAVCEPVCTSPCVNGQCVRPNECECSPGFKFHSTNRSLCEPHCEDGCVNSTCTKPNECECIEGHEKIPTRANVCQPSCSLECINGDCTAPETCTCREGYHLANTSWNNCVPDCNCTNGFCHEPNKCICFQNYTLTEEGDCDPICEGCVNATCTSPYVCECLEGYEQYNETVCVPFCSDCDNGMCIEPEECSCFEGYTREGLACEPVCSTGCANGVCTAPDKCKCDSDHDKVLENVCLPLCERNCTDCNVTDEECLFALDTTISNSSPTHQPFMRVSIPVSCNYLQNISNSTYILSDINKNNCTGITMECNAIKSLSKSHFICILKSNDSYLQDIFEGTVLNDQITQDISSLDENDIDATVLFSSSPPDAKGECELCSCFSATRNAPENKIVFQMAPCPTGVNERVNMPAMSDVSMLLYIVIAVVAISSLLIFSVIYIMNKRRIHEYVVNRNDHRKLETSEDETEMLEPDTD